MRSPPDPTTDASRRYVLLGQLISVSSPASSSLEPWHDRLDGLLAEFAVGGDARVPLSEFTVSPGLDGALWQIECDGCAIPAYSDNALLREMEQRAFTAAAHHADLPLVLHAGAVARDGVALLLPAPSGAGKSTLTLALAQRGWRPLTDDICPLARAGDEWIALPCPRCCHLSVEAVEVVQASGVALDGPVADLAGYYRPVQWGKSAPVRAIAVPRFAPAAAPRAARLTQAECLAALISATFGHARQPGSARRAAARDLAARVPGFHLTYATVDEALQLVDTVVDELMRAAPVAAADRLSQLAAPPA